MDYLKICIFMAVITNLHSQPSTVWQDLLTIAENPYRSLSSQETACCVGQNIKSCVSATINDNILGKRNIRLPGGIHVFFLNNLDNNPDIYNYGDGKGTELLISYNPKTGGMHGSAMTYQGKSFVIENCGNEGHVFKEIDISSMVDDEGYLEEELTGNFGTAESEYFELEQDTTTIVTYSVQLYYTKDFAAVTKDIKGWTDLVIDETNKGYINSKVPLRIKKHCMQQVSIADGLSSYNTLNLLQTLKPSLAQVRNSADVAVLLVDTFSDPNACGRARLFAIDSTSDTFGQTISVVKKSCGLGYYSFGHEIGHNIGLFHDIRNINPKYQYGQGSYIDKGRTYTGYRTILSYSKNGFNNRVNYYSSPNVIHPETRTRTGVEGTADNARLLTEQRFKLAGMGDESISCHSQNQECMDKSSKCNNWASKNYCNVVYVAHMRKNCQKACNFCGGRQRPTPLMNICEDTEDDSWCYRRATNKNCNAYLYVREHCSKTCNVCDGNWTSTTTTTTTPITVTANKNRKKIAIKIPKQLQCKDKDTRCTYWASQHYCEAYENIRKNCPKACNVCVGTWKQLYRSFK